MASKKKDDAGATQAPDAGATAQPTDVEVLATELAAVLDEIAALKAERAELQAQLSAKAQLSADAFAAPEPAGPPAYWKVELPHAPTHVVLAVDHANAWETYKQEMGVLGSEFEGQRTIGPATRVDYHQAQAKRHGKKLDEFPLPAGLPE